MKINDPTNKSQSLFHTYIFWISGSYETDATQYSTITFIGLANRALDKARIRIMQAMNYRFNADDQNFTTLSIGTTDVPANQDHISIADDHLTVRRVRIKDKQGNYKTLEPTDRRDLGDDELKATGEPSKFDLMGQSIFFHPIPDYSTEAELEFDRSSSYFAENDTAKTPGIAEPWHPYVALFAAKEYMLANEIGKFQAIDNAVKELDADLEIYYRDRDKSEAPAMTPENNWPIF